MSAIKLEEAKKHLAMWMEAESQVAINQSYSIGGKTFTRASLGEIRAQIAFWEGKVNQLTNIRKKGGRNRIYTVVPRDL